MSSLLPFHRTILENIHDPATSDLLVIARGLGLRRIICTLLKVYDSPENLVLLVNATAEEESAIGEQLGIMGCRNPGLRIVGYELGKKDRQDLYKKGGLMSVTSRILVVDMLQSDISTESISGILVMHADRVSATSLEAFIVRLYREKNTKGFLKAFSDQPEHITSGLSPLKNIMKELHLRTVHIYPRFHEDIKKSLERRKADVVEIFQPMDEKMVDIHTSIVQCMSSTLSELKRSNTTLDLDDLNIENAYFRDFDIIVRRQLDPIWHKVGPKTKQLVSDLATLRRLLNYLLTYDPLAFHAYLETIIASNSKSASGQARVNQSPWLLTDAANVIFKSAKRRCYIHRNVSAASTSSSNIREPDDDEWAALAEAEGHDVPPAMQSKAPARKEWIPPDMDPTLEELPKWNLLGDILKEIEDEMMRQEALHGLRPAASPGSNIVLIMTSSTQTSNLLQEYLSIRDDSAPPGSQGRRMMERKLRLYLWWKGKLAERKEAGQVHFHMPNIDFGKSDKDKNKDEGLSEAMKKKDREKQERSANRRRQRGGAPGTVASSSTSAAGRSQQPRRPDMLHGEEDMLDEVERMADFIGTQSAAVDALLEEGEGDMPLISESDLSDLFPPDFDEHYGLLSPSQTVLIRAYSDDTDDQMLAEIQPRFIITFEPNQDFVRRVEVYRSSNPGMGVRVYFMVYKSSCEEHKFLAGIRREKDSFERLIKERGSMLLPMFEERPAGNRASDAIIKTISSRLAGGRKELNPEPSQVIVDLREFRSSLPSLLHASNLLVIPATLTVGDYIITPDICVERKSLPDLASSFNSGRLFTQCELMSVHYKQPVLLIEFEEHKSFSLGSIAEIKNYAKASMKYPLKKTNSNEPERTGPTIQHKLVLLALSFPRLRIIWSSSAYATAEIFKDLKVNNAEPDPTKAISIGAEDDEQLGAGVNAAAEELLRSLPGITAKNAQYVMGKVNSVRELCEMSREAVEELLGVDPGKACYEFMHKGEKR